MFLSFCKWVFHRQWYKVGIRMLKCLGGFGDWKLWYCSCNNFKLKGIGENLEEEGRCLARGNLSLLVPPELKEQFSLIFDRWDFSYIPLAPLVYLPTTQLLTLDYHSMNTDDHG